MYIRRNRIKTETHIPPSDEPIDHLKRVKIKNFRFSFEQKHALRPESHSNLQPGENTRQPAVNKTMVNRLPELAIDKESDSFRKVELPKPKMNLSHQKKDKLLNQIVLFTIVSCTFSNHLKRTNLPSSETGRTSPATSTSFLTIDLTTPLSTRGLPRFSKMS